MSGLGSPQRLAFWILVLFSLALISSSTGQAAASNSSVNFGNVQVGSSVIMPITITNTYKVTVNISQATASGSGFSFAGPNLPIAIAPQQSASLSVAFSPQTAGSFSGILTASGWGYWGGHGNVHTSNFSVALSGSSYTAGYLSAPPTLNLGTITLGSSQTQTLSLSNSGGSSLTISGATVTGTGFTVSGLSFPYILAAGANASLSVTFAPTVAGTDTATLSISSNASDPSVSVSLSGSGTSSSGNLGVTPGSIGFGAVAIGTTGTQSGSVTASGGSVTLSSVSSSSSEFIVGGLTLPVTIASGQSVPFTLTFAPTTTGTATANISFFTSSSSSAVETASGSGSTIQHTVNLSWDASTSTSITGYNVYRGSVSGGPYSKINSALDALLSYSDGTVQSGQTYYYVTTAVDSAGAESSYSSEVPAGIPFP